MRRRLVIAGALVVAAPSAFAQQQDLHATVAVGTAVARRGQVAYGALRIAAAVDSATSLPVPVVNGRRSGPLRALLAGRHATRCTPILPRRSLIRQHAP